MLYIRYKNTYTHNYYSYDLRMSERLLEYTKTLLFNKYNILIIIVIKLYHQVPLK